MSLARMCGVAIAALAIPQSWCPQKQFVGRPGGNRILIIMFGSFLPGLLVGLHHQSLLGPESRHCYGINYAQNALRRAIRARL